MTLVPTADQGAEICDAEELGRLLWRLARELQERHPESRKVTLCGIHTRGVHLAERLVSLIRLQGGGEWGAVGLDVGPYRDDLPRPAEQGSDRASTLPPATPADIQDKVVILVDDVLFHGRTARAALVALSELGRPLLVELLVLVDRGHRELPLRATYVGRNLPTASDQRVLVRLREVDGVDAVVLTRPEEGT